MNALISTKYYLKRAFTQPLEVALMTLLPLGIIFLNVSMNLYIMTEEGWAYMYGDYNMMATVITMLIMLMFQFMSGAYSGDFIYEDLRCDRRWRLNAAPVNTSSHVFGAIAASMIFSLTTAALILAVGYLFFDVYLGNIAIVIPVVFFSALISQFMGIIIALFVKKKGAINGIMIGLSFFMSALIGGFMVNIPAPEFVRENIIPTGVAFRAVSATMPGDVGVGLGHGAVQTGMSDALISLAILAGMAVVFGIATLIIARRRPA